jgi:hypothetical protein
MEVVGGSTGRSPHAALPASHELEEALAALDVLAGRTPPPPAQPNDPSANRTTATPELSPAPVLEPEPAPRPAWPMADRSAAPKAPTTSGMTSTPASRAYRRLRRIFPS